MRTFATPTEKSFYNFITKHGHNIVKITTGNSPDFLVDDKYAFEIKALNISGTQTSTGLVISQRINIDKAIIKYLGDATKKINSYNKIKSTEYSALVIYNLRPLIDFETILIPALKSIDINRYPRIDSLILAGYNETSNLTTALHILSKGNEPIIKNLLKDLSYAYIV